MSFAGPARAYVWMIRHGESGCASCHEDPSGGGLLTDFGLGEAADSLRSHYGSEPPAVQRFFGLPTPAWLLLGGSFRGMDLAMKTDGAPLTNTFILMQADLRAGIAAGHWHAAASLGLLTNGSSPAAIVTSQGGPSVVAREYWVGYDFLDNTLLLRAGRINLPYGLRVIEHTFYVREATRVDINDTQQIGVAVAYRRGPLRGELMGIAGNYQVSPDAYRERGYSGYLEWSPASGYAFGVSSLVTYAARDVYLQVANLRQAHGVTARVSPWEPLVLLGEFDYVPQSPSGLGRWDGYAGLLQADLEPWQGVHLMSAGEVYSPGMSGTPTSWGIWAGAGWFFMSHADVRFDYRHGEDTLTFGATSLTKNDAYMVQLHIFL
jgi:hypothetical protein